MRGFIFIFINFPFARGAKALQQNWNLLPHHRTIWYSNVLLTLDSTFWCISGFKTLMIRYRWERKSGQDIVWINTTGKNLTTWGETALNERRSHGETWTFSLWLSGERFMKPRSIKGVSDCVWTLGAPPCIHRAYSLHTPHPSVLRSISEAKGCSVSVNIALIYTLLHLSLAFFFFIFVWVFCHYHYVSYYFPSKAMMLWHLSKLAQYSIMLSIRAQ